MPHRTSTRLPSPSERPTRPQPLLLPPELEHLRHHPPSCETQFPPDTQPPAGSGRVELFTPPADASSPAATPHDRLPPHAIPGYTLEAIIGTGGMGTVYRARQLSLDRQVAIKVMSNTWASDPVFAARFVREAFAAAQLNHPNVVQVFDVGEAGGARYFSMEFVGGKSLAEVLKADGPPDVDTAVGYALQAARGLKHAHDRGIIHRDVKPDNLLLDTHGVVKLADLGLVKTPDLSAKQDSLSSASGLHTIPPDMTGVRVALGTPAYMAPEQCRDATAVDHRADIYSLGCTLYALLTGRPPFEADDTVGLMTKQAYEPPVPPEQLNPRVPAEVSALVMRMMAKNPADRPRTAGEVVRTLEAWLGVRSNGPAVPRSDDIAAVEKLAGRFFASPAARSRRRVVNAFASVCGVAAVLLLFFGKVGYAFGVAGLLLHAAGTYFVLHGYARKSYLWGRVRRFAGGLSVGDWAVACGAAGLAAALLWAGGLLAVWAGFGLIGAAAAVVLAVGFDARREVERFPVLAEADELVKRLRKRSWSEAEVKGLFAKFSGRRWEEFFEAVFGFEAKLQTRAEWRGAAAGRRAKYAAWREPVAALLNHVESQRRKARDRALLEQTEYDRLRAMGLPKAAARRRAEKNAASFVEHAADLHDAPHDHPSTPAAGFRPFLQPDPADAAEAPSLLDRYGWLWEWTLSRPTRAVLAALLVAACGWWAIQNDLIRLGGREEKPVLPLAVPGVPVEFTNWCDTVNAGWGGILLLVSLVYRGRRAAALTLLGTAVAVAGHKFGIRTVPPVEDYHVAIVLGTVLALVGWRLGRR